MGSNSRFWVPATVVALIGVAILYVPQELLSLRGGLGTTGGYALALQVVLAALLVAAIGDALDPATVDTWRALRRYYRSSFVPALGVAFGMAVSLTAMAIWVLDGAGRMIAFSKLPFGLGLWLWPSELAIGALVLLTGLPMLMRSGAGAAGWCVGLAVGCAMAQLQFSSHIELLMTWLGWLAFAGAVCAIGAVTRSASSMRQRRLARHAES